MPAGALSGIGGRSLGVDLLGRRREVIVAEDVRGRDPACHSPNTLTSAPRCGAISSPGGEEGGRGGRVQQPSKKAPRKSKKSWELVTRSPLKSASEAKKS